MVKVQRRSVPIVSRVILSKLAKELQDLPEKSKAARNGSSAGESEKQLKPALESFKQGWKEVRCGKTKLLSDVWDDIDS
jgi:hypothetical protein